MRIKPSAIFFDLDGVLVDSLDAWWIALNYALESFSHAAISRNEFIKRYWGHDLNDNLRRIGLSSDVGIFCNDFYSRNLDAVRIYPDTRDTLQKLGSYRKVVITNTPKNCAFQILKRFDIEKYFDLIITSDDVKRGKPSPEIVFKACAALDVSPKDVVLVGDTDSDVRAGKAAGCMVVGIHIKADITIHRLSELIRILE